MRTIAAILVTGFALGLTSVVMTSQDVPPAVLAADLVVGWTMIVVGVVVRSQVPSTRTGLLLILAGVAWFAGNLFPLLVVLHRAVFAHLLLAYPTGRLRSPRTRLAAGSAYVGSLLAPFARPVVPSLAFGVGFLTFGMVAAVQGRRRSRRRTVAAIGAVAIGAVLLLGAIARWDGTPDEALLLFAYEMALTGTAIALGVDSIFRRMSGGLLAQVVVDLGDAGISGSVRERLALAVGDPSLVVAFEAADGSGRYLDEAGLPVSLPEPGDQRVASAMVVGERHIGVIVHDPAVLGDAAVVARVAAATELAMANSRLQGSIRARLAQVDASRARLVHAGDIQRRRIEADIRSGAARRLESARVELERAVQEPDASGELAAILEEVGRAREELLDFARGVHPALLTEGGLTAALADLAERSSLRIEVRVRAGRPDPAIESTLYFVAAEAVANAEKHGQASSATVLVRTRRDVIELNVVDDGIGGAVIRDGGGLRGLTDRVEALGGSLTIASSASGTRLTATIPQRRNLAVGRTAA